MNDGSEKKDVFGLYGRDHTALVEINSTMRRAVAAARSDGERATRGTMINAVAGLRSRSAARLEEHKKTYSAARLAVEAASADDSGTTVSKDELATRVQALQSARVALIRLEAEHAVLGSVLEELRKVKVD